MKTQPNIANKSCNEHSPRHQLAHRENTMSPPFDRWFGVNTKVDLWFGVNTKVDFVSRSRSSLVIVFLKRTSTDFFLNFIQKYKVCCNVADEPSRDWNRDGSMTRGRNVAESRSGSGGKVQWTDSTEQCLCVCLTLFNGNTDLSKSFSGSHPTCSHIPGKRSLRGALVRTKHPQLPRPTLWRS